MFLADAIEKGFDALKLSFVRQNPLSADLSVKIWADDCRNKPLWRGSDRTVGEFDGCVLSLGEHVVFKRALSYQAHQAYLVHSLLDSDQRPDDYGTPGNYPCYSERQSLEAEFYRAASDELEQDEFGVLD